MQKEKENLNPVQMFSKIGRYISERIVPIDHRKSHSNVRKRTSKPSRQHSKDKTPQTSDSSASTPNLRPLLSNRPARHQ